jgi:hypothetical protein
MSEEQKPVVTVAEQSSPEQSSPEQSSPEQSLPEQSSPEQSDTSSNVVDNKESIATSNDSDNPNLSKNTEDAPEATPEDAALEEDASEEDASEEDASEEDASEEAEDALEEDALEDENDIVISKGKEKGKGKGKGKEKDKDKEKEKEKGKWCFQNELDTYITLDMFKDPDVINNKPTHLVEQFIEKTEPQKILAFFKSDKGKWAEVEHLEKLDARYVFAMRDIIKQVNEHYYKKGAWYYEFVFKYIINNIVFISLFSMCTILPSYLAFLICKAIYNVDTPDYMKRDNLDKATTISEEEDDEDKDEDENDDIDNDIDFSPLNAEDLDDPEEEEEEEKPEFKLTISAMYAFGAINTLLTGIFILMAWGFYNLFIPLCYSHTTVKGFHLLPNSPVQMDIITLVKYVVLYQLFMWLHLGICTTHYAYDSTGESGAVLYGLPAGMIPPNESKALTNDAFYNFMTFSRYISYSAIAMYIIMPLIIFWMDVKPVRFPNKDKDSDSDSDSDSNN